MCLKQGQAVVHCDFWLSSALLSNTELRAGANHRARGLPLLTVLCQGVRRLVLTLQMLARL